MDIERKQNVKTLKTYNKFPRKIFLRSGKWKWEAKLYSSSNPSHPISSRIAETLMDVVWIFKEIFRIIYEKREENSLKNKEIRDSSHYVYGMGRKMYSQYFFGKHTLAMRTEAAIT